MNVTLNRKLIFCAVLVVTLLTTFVAYAKEPEFTAVQWVEKGKEFQAIKNFDSAILAYNQAINLDPQMGKAYAQRGKIYIFMKQYDLAVADFTKNIEIEPRNEDLYWLRGLAYAGKGQHQLAIDEYNETLRINPKMYMAYWNSTLSYERLRSNYLAMQSYQNFLQYAPSQDPNIEIAKKRLKELQTADKARIEATSKSFDSINDVTATRYIFDFLKKDYLILRVDKARWKIGFQQNSDRGVSAEFVSGNETVKLDRINYRSIF